VKLRKEFDYRGEKIGLLILAHKISVVAYVGLTYPISIYHCLVFIITIIAITLTYYINVLSKHLKILSYRPFYNHFV